MAQYAEKDPAETVSYGMDFGGVVFAPETISSASAVLSTYIGADSDAILNDSPVIEGYVVRQIVSGGQNGSVYRLLFTVTTSSSQTFAGVGYIPCNSL